MSTYTVQCINIDKWAVHFYVRGIGILRHFHLEFLRLIYFKLFYIMSRFPEFQFKCPKNVHKPPFSGQKSVWLETGHVGYQTIQNFILILHCPKSNPNFRDITWNVEENEILQYCTWSIPHSNSFSPLHFILYRGKLISFGTV